MAIVNDGKLKLLAAQISYLNTLYFGLFTNNVTPIDGTAWSALTEAGWSGYARVAANNWGTPAIVSNAAQSLSAINPLFSNTTGSSQTFYGWFLIDASGGTPVLIAASNIGLTTIPAGQSYGFAPGITDNDVAG